MRNERRALGSLSPIESLPVSRAGSASSGGAASGAGAGTATAGGSSGAGGGPGAGGAAGATGAAGEGTGRPGTWWNCRGRAIANAAPAGRPTRAAGGRAAERGNVRDGDMNRAIRLWSMACASMLLAPVGCGGDAQPQPGKRTVRDAAAPDAAPPAEGDDASPAPTESDGPPAGEGGTPARADAFIYVPPADADPARGRLRLGWALT